MSRSMIKRRLFRLVVPKYPSFNVYSHIARKTTALGPLCVATMVSKLRGWDVEVIDENNYRHPGPLDANNMPDHEALQEARRADIVGFYGSLSCTIPRLQQVAHQYQSWGVLTIGGGHHLDSMPEEGLQNGLDIVVHGEAEETITEIVEAFCNGGDYSRIIGISYKKDGSVCRTGIRPPLEYFEHLPLPDFGLLRYAKLSVYPISRIRGCGANCEFCSVKGRARCASPERLLAQVAYLAESFRAREFFVVDDQFAQNRKETLRFCEMLRDYQQKTGLKFFITIQIRLEMARDEELLNAMRECNIRCLAIGFESVIDEELKAMGKGLRSAEMLDLVANYRRYGFLIHGMFIFAYPMRDGVVFDMPMEQRVQRFRRFIHMARLDTVQVLLPVPLPGTTFRDRLVAQGRVLPLDKIGWEYYDGNFPLIIPDAPLTPMQIQQAIMKIMGNFYKFRHMFGIGFQTLYFPFAMLPLVNIEKRFRRWYRPWRNDIIRFAGWCIVRNWRKNYRKDRFSHTLRGIMASFRQHGRI